MKLFRIQRTTLILGILAFVLVLANSYVWFFRLDLTSTGAYTVSDTSRKLLKQLPGQVEIDYYLSSTLKTKFPEFQGIEDLLKECALASEGKITFNVIDPQDPQITQQMGFSAVPMSTVEKTQETNTYVFSGLMIKMLDKQSIIPFVRDSGTLEYDLGTRIKEFTEERKKNIGLLVGTSTQNPNQEPFKSYQIIQQQFSKLYNIKTIQRGEDIPADVDVLFAFKIDDFSIDELAKVESFALTGKGVLIGVDPYSIILQQSIFGIPPQPNNELYKMLDAWGAKVESNLVIDAYCLPFPNTFELYPYWVRVDTNGANRDTIIGTKLQSLDLFWPSSVSLKEGAKGMTLFTSTDKAKTLTGQADMDPNNGKFLYQSTQTPAARSSLGVAIQGPINSYTASKAKVAPQLTKSDKSRVIVIGDGEFASDMIQVTNSRGNLDFLHTASVWLTGDEDLIALGARGETVKRLDKITEPDQRQATEDWIIIVNAVILPLAIVGFAVFRRFGRNKAKAKEV